MKSTNEPHARCLLSFKLVESTAAIVFFASARKFTRIQRATVSDFVLPAQPPSATYLYLQSSSIIASDQAFWIKILLRFLTGLPGPQRIFTISQKCPARPKPP